MKLRKNLTNTRKKAGLTQLELVKILNITEQHYQRLEAGTSGGSIKLWKRLATFFNETIDYLLEYEADSKEDLFETPQPLTERKKPFRNYKPK